MCFFPNLFLGIPYFWFPDVRELQAKGVKSLRVRGGPVGWMFFTVSPGWTQSWDDVSELGVSKEGNFGI